MTRRKFIKKSGTGVIGTILATYLGTGCALTKTYRVAVNNGELVSPLQNYPELLSAGGSVILIPDGLQEPIVVTNIDGITFSAVSAICAHMGCTVRVEKNFLLCPCHGSTYDLNGKVVRGPAVRSLKKFKIEVKNGNITIFINQKEN